MPSSALEVGTPCVNTMFEDDPWAPAYVAGRALGHRWRRGPSDDLGGPDRLRAAKDPKALAAYLRDVAPRAGFLLGELVPLAVEDWEGTKARLLVTALDAMRRG